MKRLLILPVVIVVGLLNLGVASSDEISHALVKRAADAAFTVYYPFLEKDIYPLPKIIVKKGDADPSTSNRGWFFCKDEKCSVYVVIDNHPTENELIYTIAHELVHVFFTVQGLPVQKHHYIMYCEGYDRIMAKKVGYTGWNTFIPTGVKDLCRRMKK